MTESNKLMSWLLCSHVREMTERLRQIPEDKWDWTPAPPAPTPRILASHTFQWLVCDRQHIEEPDAAKHPLVPESPVKPAAMCDALDAETDRWEVLLRRLTPEEMEEMRSQFNDYLMPVKGFVGHIVQNAIYKHGQIATLFFALGLDGDAPYDAPFPNTYYAMLHEAESHATP